MPPATQRATRRTKAKEEETEPKPKHRETASKIPGPSRAGKGKDKEEKKKTVDRGANGNDRRARVAIILPIPPATPEPEDPEAPKPDKYKEDRKSKSADRDEERTAQGWPVGKCPTTRHILRGAKKRILSLPRAYRGGNKSGSNDENCQHLTVSPGEDLNNVVWKCTSQLELTATVLSINHPSFYQGTTRRSLGET